MLQVSNMLKAYYTSEQYLGIVRIPPWGLWENAPNMPPRTPDAEWEPLRRGENQNDLQAATFFLMLDGLLQPTLGSENLENVSSAVASFFNYKGKDGVTARNILKNSLVYSASLFIVYIVKKPNNMFVNRSATLRQ